MRAARPRALLLDFNGTLSDDEPLLARLYEQLFAEHGRPLPAERYLAEFAGLADVEIIRAWLGEGVDVEAVVAERIDRFRAASADGSTIGETVREAVGYAAERVPVAIVSSAFRAEIEPVLAAAGLSGLVRGIVATEDVARCKPDPEGYRLGLELVGAAGEPARVLALEDTEAGIAAAKGAGLRCLAVAGTLPPERLAGADGIVEAVDVALMRALLG